MEELETIAIIGMAGRFPKAENTEALWKLIRNKELGITFLTDEELRREGVSEEQISDPEYVKAKGVLADVEMFDAEFFSYTPREAEFMDPQQRIFLECCWEALESAGYAGEERPSNTGVFGGASFNTYLFNLFSNPKLLESYSFFQAMLVNDRDYLTTRVSYELNLTGPSVNVQTGCSSSLVAVHLACQSLLNFESDMALAGGVSVTLPSRSGYQYHSGGIASPDGYCRAFDARAKGTVNGNGSGVVLLKRLSEALADGDTIYAVIKGSAINNDGSNKIGFTAPGVEGQSKVIVEALTVAGVHPESIAYIETHGTGTPLGDPIEVRALSRAFQTKTSKKNYCAIGSIKSNIGHLDAAAGVTGLIKAALSLWHKEIPPTMNFEKPNPELNIEETPFCVNAELRTWEPVSDHPRRASVSSFGIGGTNSHLVLEESPVKKETPATNNTFHILPLSAKTPSALKKSALNLAARISNEPELALADAAYTLQVGRKAFSYRTAIVCRDSDEAVARLKESGEKPDRQFEKVSASPRLFLMFPGQGSQRLGMGSELYESEQIFRERVDFCADLLRPLLDLDIRRVMFGGDREKEKAEQRLKQTIYTQPALFVIEYALANLLMEKFGIRPDGLIGHSLGEYVAACLAKVFTPEEALKLVTERGRLMQAQPPGQMLAVGLAKRLVSELLSANNENRVSIAGINAPDLTIISGETEAVRKWKDHFDASGCFNRLLETSHAFHSPMMEPVLPEFSRLFSDIRPGAPQIRFISNLTGEWVTAEACRSSDYWTAHLRRAVDFDGGIKTLCGEGEAILLEVGPGNTLCSLAQKQPDAAGIRVIPMLNLTGAEPSERRALANGLGKIWESGSPIRLSETYAGERRRRVPLPSYPFERKRFWIDRNSSSFEVTSKVDSDLIQKPEEEWYYLPTWQKDTYLNEPASAENLSPLLEEQGEILLLADGSVLSQQVFETLARATSKVTKVLQGDGFEQVEPHVYCLSGEAEDYVKLLLALEEQGRRPQTIINFWTCLSPGPTGSLDEDLTLVEKTLKNGFYSLTYFMQALGARALSQGLEKIEGKIKIVAVTRNLYQVLGSEKIEPAQALVSGVCRVIPQEYANVEVQHVDIDDYDQTNLAAAAARIISQIGRESSPAVIAFRGKSGWKQIFEKIAARGPAEKASTGFKRNGVYLITGGLGGIGLALASYLTETYDAKVVLLSRTGIAPPKQWRRILADETADAKLKKRAAKLLSLREKRADFYVFAADIANLQETSAVIDQIRQKVGSVDGIIHAAGLPGETLIQFSEPSKAKTVIDPKVSGLINLQYLFKDEPLDFMLLFSSHRSITGGAGGADYSSANAFLDAFARAHDEPGRKVQSIIWDGWKEVGMAVETAERLSLNPEHAIETGVTVSEGLSALEKALQMPYSEVIISTHDFPRVIERSRRKPETSSAAGFAADPENFRANNRPPLSTPYVEPQTPTEKIIVDIWQRLLGISSIGTADNFFELGGDSVLCIQVVAQSNKKGLSLTAQHVFQYQTISELVSALDNKTTSKPEQAVVTGELPLIPIQKWFFEQPLENRNHFNQAMLFEIGESVDPVSLRAATERLLTQHDALRMSFSNDNGQWVQINHNVGPEVPFESISVEAFEAPAEEVIKRARIIQESLDIEKGRLFRVVHFDLGENSPSRVLLICHHLVVDAISWRFVVEDLFALYEAIRRQKEVSLPAKTFSFQAWATALDELAQSEAIKPDADYWLALAGQKIEGPGAAVYEKLEHNTIESEAQVKTILDRDTTRYILNEAVSSLRIQMVEAILTSVVLGISRWSGRNSMVIDFEGHGRDFPLGDIDVTRTVGWFTTLYPVLFEVPLHNIEQALRNVKDQFRRVPNKGNNFGLLRYSRRDKGLSERLSKIPRADLSFLYLGRVDDASGADDGRIKTVTENVGNLIDPGSLRTHLFSITSFILNNQLQIELSYSQNLYPAQAMTALLEEITRVFQEIRSYAKQPDQTVISASDFPDADFEADDLESLLSQVSEQNFI